MQIISLFGQMTTDYGDPYYQTTTNSSVDAATAAGIIAFVMVFTLILVAIIYVIHAFLLSRIFKKAGIETWKAWVPIYNSWVLLELGDQKGYWAVLALIPFVNIASAVFMFIAMYHIGLKLGKEGVFVLLAIFLPLVWMIWLAVDGSTWKGSKPVAAPVTPNTDQPNTPPAAQQ
jgi:hypothetical protein